MLTCRKAIHLKTRQWTSIKPWNETQVLIVEWLFPIGEENINITNWLYTPSKRCMKIFANEKSYHFTASGFTMIRKSSRYKTWLDTPVYN